LTNNTKVSYWTDKNYADINVAPNYSDLVDVAFEIIARMPKPLVWVCGPISNGGMGSINSNTQVFQNTIDILNKKGKNAFNQLAFGVPLNRIYKGTLKKGIYKRYGMGEKTAMLEGFYTPIFESGNINTLFFIPDWHSSPGAKWEHAQAKRIGLHVKYL